MTLKIGYTDELANTQYAPLAVHLFLYQQQAVFAPLDEVHLPIREREFRVQAKLVQVLVSMLSGCETLSEVNGRLKAEHRLAQVLSGKRFADQSNLSRTLDELDGQPCGPQAQASQKGYFSGKKTAPDGSWRG